MKKKTKKDDCQKKYFKKELKDNRAITLIALVITIIVLLILAGVSIATLTGDNGLLTRAQNVKNKTEQATEEELKKLTQAEAAMHFEEYEYTDINGTKVNIPAQCAVSQVEGEDSLEFGLVIIDANGNEWVWIEVPKTIYEDTNYNNNGTRKPLNSGDYNNIEYVLQQYTSTYRDNSNQGVGTGTDEWYDGNGLTEAQSKNKEDITGCGLTSKEYSQLKQKLLKSIYENGGFFIGRYEVGIKEEDTVRNYIEGQSTEYPINETPVIQANKVVYNWIRTSQAQELSEKLAVGGKTSSLMFGVQRDLILKYIETKNPIFGDSGKTTQQKLKEDSTSWGNYSNIGFSIINGNAKYSEDNGASYIQVTQEGYLKPDSSRLLTTGATERNAILEIYDLSGNVYERTLEKSPDTSNPCSFVGGCYFSNGANVPASYRGYGKTSYSYYYTGFRPTLY